jgi:two-component system LytT family sensor kinase
MRESSRRDKSKRRMLSREWLFLAGWGSVVLLFASQWYAYDATRRAASPFAYYLGWSCLIWLLAPFVFWFARRHPLAAHNWQASIALHLVAGVMLSGLQVIVESGIGWLRHAHELPFGEALGHYFGQHLQLYLLTYWVLVAVAQVYRMHTDVRERELRAAQLEAQLSAAHLETLRAQLQPHFLFNTLHAAVALVHHDPDAAEDVLLRLSSLLRASLAELRADEIPLHKELEFLECYVGIQQRRFGERLRVEFHVDRTVLDCAVPSLVLQPLVENAIRHGIGAHKGSDVVAVSAYLEKGALTLEIRNQSSTLAEAPDQLLRRGVGLSNTRARLRQLYGHRQAMELIGLEPRGVCVRLLLPARQQPAPAPVPRCEA